MPHDIPYSIPYSLLYAICSILYPMLCTVLYTTPHHTMRYAIRSTNQTRGHMLLGRLDTCNTVSKWPSMRTAHPGGPARGRRFDYSTPHYVTILYGYCTALPCTVYHTTRALQYTVLYGHA